MGVIQDMCLDDTYKGREVFSKIKAHLKKAAARTREALVEAMREKPSRPSRPKTRGAGSSTAATKSRINVHEHRCEAMVERTFRGAIESGVGDRVRVCRGGANSFPFEDDMLTLVLAISPHLNPTSRRRY